MPSSSSSSCSLSSTNRKYQSSHGCHIFRAYVSEVIAQSYPMVTLYPDNSGFSFSMFTMQSIVCINAWIQYGSRIRNKRDYVYGKCQNKVLSIKSYLRVNQYERKILCKTWTMYKTWIKAKTKRQIPLHHITLSSTAPNTAGRISWYAWNTPADFP